MKLAALISGEIHRDDFANNPKLAAVRAACLARLDELGSELLLPLLVPGQPLLGVLALGPRTGGTVAAQG